MQGDGGRRVLLVSLPTSLPPPYCRIFLCGMNANQLSICRFFLGFDCFRLVRQCKGAEGDEPPPYYWCNFEGQHIRGKDIVVIEFVSFSNSFGKSMILR